MVTKEAWEIRRKRYGDSGVSEEGLVSLRENQIRTNFGKSPSGETKDKISLGNKGKHSHLVGRSVSGETKHKISSAQKGKKCPQRGRKGRIITEEWRRKLSESRKGIVVDRSKHDARIMAEVARLRVEGHKVIPSGLWKFPIPDLVKVKDGIVTAVEIELRNNNKSRLEYKIKRYREYFDSVDVVE